MSELSKLGKYEIRGELGQGAMGVVYDGFDPLIGRRVALKTVRRDQLERAEVEEILARFMREAQAAGRLNHPNIVAIYEYGEDAGTAFIAMEYVAGRELKEIFDADERFPMSEIVRIMSQLLDALDYSHQNGVVHRDIKPANIILLENGTVKVADFGIARIESSNLTQAGSVLGTPSYMSPEQFMGQTVDGRSDLFSAGVILYQFLTGEKPFTGALTTIMHKVLKEEPTAPSILNVQVPRPFDALIRKALAKRPDERFQSGREFAEALQQAAQGRGAEDDATVFNDPEATLAAAAPVAEPPPTPSVATAPAKPPEATPAVPSANTRVKKSAARLVFIGVLAVAALGLGATAFLLLGRTAPQDDQALAATESSAPPAAAHEAGSQSSADPNLMTISALGLADPNDPRYQNDQGLLKADLREDARRQLIEKAVGLYVNQSSLAANYALLRDRLLSRSGEFIQAVLEEQPPQLGQDGLMSLTTRATVRVRDVQKSLNQMSQEERVEFIRNNGDPKISVAIQVRSAESDPDAPPQRSLIAENLLKERIQSFGFRLWNDDSPAEGRNGADFAVTGEAKFRKLSAKLAASGLTIEKFVLSSWTVKATDKKSGEEIYYNTQIPEKTSWTSEDEALRDIGRLIGEEFSKGFFLAHFHFSGQAVRLRLMGLPDRETPQILLHELNGLRNVLAVQLSDAGADSAVFETQLSGGLGQPADLVESGILQPLNHKLGRSCFQTGTSNGREVEVRLDASCRQAEILGRLSRLPPAALIEAPEIRREAVVRDPETRNRIAM